MIENEPFVCADCVACVETNPPYKTSYKCKFDGEKLDFDVKTKTPCRRFMSATYIAALNYDTR
jgi:hypothetical protein